MDNLKREMEFAARLAEEAGAITLRYFQKGIEAQWKADATPVTIADLEAEKLIRERIRREFPQDGILGEEEETIPGTSGRQWIVDPLDGTKSFLQGVPLYGVLIALEGPEGPVVGAIGLPAVREILYAARGEGCFWNGRKARISAVAELKDACLVYTSFRNFDKAGPRFAAAFERLAGAARICRGWGDAYGYALVATGRAEAMLDPVINPWDIAPMIPILEEAGGTFTDWDGRRTIRSGNGLATNGRLLEAILKLASA
ncbi:MAG: histidinol-phosphatase [Planctomycetes bacterium]|nr:histidinol-phosphatase [Planctomycetota bacterium]